MHIYIYIYIYIYSVYIGLRGLLGLLGLLGLGRARLSIEGNPSLRDEIPQGYVQRGGASGARFGLAGWGSAQNDPSIRPVHLLRVFLFKSP